MAEAVKTVDDYKVGEGDVFLSMRIGEGQTGTTEVLLGTTPLVTVSGDIGSLRIGSGADLAGKKLNVRSIINDVMSNTNRMAVTYELRGGTRARNFDADGEVATNFGLLRFRAVFTFVE
jgi:hypothetical protein